MSDQLTASVATSAWPRSLPVRVVLAAPAPDAASAQPSALVVAVRPADPAPEQSATPSEEAAAPAEGEPGARWWQAVRPNVAWAAFVRHGLAPTRAAEGDTPDRDRDPWPPEWRDHLAATGSPSGRDGDLTTLPVPAAVALPTPRLVLVGLDPAAGATRLRRTAAVLARQLRGKPSVTVLLPALDAESVRAFVEGLVLGAHQPPGLHEQVASPATPTTFTLDIEGARQSDVDIAQVHALATLGARELALTPSNIKNPEWLADRAAELAGGGVTVRVRHLEELREAGFGGLVTVGAGSASPPVLVELDYVPAGGDPHQAPVVLVGKGITYDTGGLSIKPRESMVAMKTDMAAAGAVLEVLRACPALGIGRRVVGLLPCAENAVGAASYRPSDVVTHYGGRTVEVANTDAEGRMVLADALAYAAADLAPAAVVDLATLTGAATLGLGKRHAALFTDDESLAASLQAAAGASGEQVWRMPLVADYLPALESEVADLRHVPAKPVWGAGSITAALFLREFAAGTAWAHLDIAGTARADKDEYEVSRGATGFGARLLLRWLEAGGPDPGPRSSAVGEDEE